MRSVIRACAVALLGIAPLGMAAIPGPPPQGLRVPMRIAEAGPVNGLALLELARGGMPTADLLPPSGAGNPITRVSGGVLLSLGALIFGERFLRWWRNRNR